MTKWLFMASDNEGAENIWDLHIIDCDYEKALGYCLAKAKKYVAAHDGTPDEDFYKLDKGGYYVQYPDYHVAFLVVKLEDIMSTPALSEYSVQDIIDEAANDYSRWQYRYDQEESA